MSAAEFTDTFTVAIEGFSAVEREALAVVEELVRVRAGRLEALRDAARELTAEVAGRDEPDAASAGRDEQGFAVGSLELVEELLRNGEPPLVVDRAVVPTDELEHAGGPSARVDDAPVPH